VKALEMVQEMALVSQLGYTSVAPPFELTEANHLLFHTDQEFSTFGWLGAVQ
jgi:hypothetical protein